ncbi:MAG: formate dehydrogenase subunit alpha, partial [Bacillota bacterium]
ARLREAAVVFGRAARASIVYSMGITQHTTGTDNVLSIANLAMLTGNVGRESTGVNPLRGQNNVQGACDMGALPNVYPGYQAVTAPEAREKFEKAWRRQLSPRPGLTVTEIIRAAGKGDIRGLFILGENPMLSDPDIHHVEEALRATEFLVVQDIFLTETAALAHVVLPGVSFAEKDGTFTNTERRVQRVRRAVPPASGSRPDWLILADLAGRFGLRSDYDSPADIMDEIAGLTPSYGGISYSRLDGPDAATGLQWPCPSPGHPGTRFLHEGKFTRGKGLFSAVDYLDPAELPDDQYPLILTTGRVLYHFHTATMSRRSAGLAAVFPEGYVEVNPETAAGYGLADGDPVRVVSRRGSIIIRVAVTSGISRGVVFIPFHFREAAANVLTNPAVDPKAKIPEFKVAAVSIEKLASGAAEAAESLAGAGAGVSVRKGGGR